MTVLTTLDPTLSRGNATEFPGPRTAPVERNLTAGALVLAHLTDIRFAIRTVVRRRRLSEDETDELSSIVFLRLLQRDGTVLRQFRGESTLRTFLVVVVRRILQDVWTAQRGKWRPSVTARSLGRVAVQLEQSIYRDGMRLPEAAEAIRGRTGAAYSDDELGFMLSLLPPRPPKRFVGEDCLRGLASPEPSPLDALLERSTPWRGARLAAAMRTLSAEDRRLVTLRFQGGRTVAELARLEGTDQKRLYRQFDRAFRQLRAAIEGGTPQ